MEDLNLRYFWDKQAKSNYVRSTVGENRIFYPWLPPIKGEAKVLDLGCGWGRTIIPMAKRGAFVIGLDISIEMLRICKIHLKKFDVTADLVLASATNPPFKGEVFEMVMTFAVLLHLPKEHVKTSIKEIYRCLKPKGLAYFASSFPNKFIIVNLQRYFTYNVYARILRRSLPVVHIRCYNYFEVFNIFCKKYRNIKIFPKLYEILPEEIIFQIPWKSMIEKINVRLSEKIEKLNLSFLRWIGARHFFVFAYK